MTASVLQQQSENRRTRVPLIDHFHDEDSLGSNSIDDRRNNEDGEFCDDDDEDDHLRFKQTIYQKGFFDGETPSSSKAANENDDGHSVEKMMMMVT